MSLPGAVRRRITMCRRCSLRETALRPVPFFGPLDAGVMVIGEAPGSDEEMTRRPFSGPSGQLLRSSMAEVGLHPDSMFWCNVVSCRPPGNATPERAHIAACSPNLALQTHLVRPHVTLLVGSTALGVFRPKAKITKLNGRPFYRPETPGPRQVHIPLTFDEPESNPPRPVRASFGRVMLPIIHPAAVMRNRRLLPAFSQTLLSLRLMVDRSVWEVWPTDCERCSAPEVRYDAAGVPWCHAHYPPGPRRTPHATGQRALPV
jgi:DNA polymerase